MAPSRAAKRSREPATSGRSRSFGGCATCRMRHMKCDERKPTCLMCQHFGTVCSGYEKNIFFTSEDDDGIERFRRPLFTETEREQMSWSLIYSVPAKFTLLNVLSQLDEECENAQTNSVGLCVSRGPFGAFKLAQHQHQPEPETNSSSVEILEHFLPPLEDTDITFSPAAFTFSPGTQDMFDTFFQHPEDMTDVSSPNNVEFDIGHSRTENLFAKSVSPLYTGHFSSALEFPTCEAIALLPNDSPPYSISSVSTTGAGIVPDCAVHLLKHYSTSVIGVLTPSSNSKTPWHILFLPHVKNTLAALSMGEALDHASLSAFYGTLSISAFHMKAASKNDDWYEKGCQYRQRAREHVRMALRTAYNVPKIAKYKSILIALLTMVQVSMFDGDWKQTECYLLETEKFIRLRGLHRRKSRKRRLLHHCYVFIRLLHESLFSSATTSPQRIDVRMAVESSGLVVRGQDRPFFKLASWRNLVQRMLDVKSREEGENDLHLEQPGVFSATMYPEIYGIPEEWFFMLSQVIRLGNEKEPQPDGKNSLTLNEFSSRAKDLEQCIINWHQPTAEIIATNEQANNADERTLHPLLDAMHQALIIYFYRRIYDVDASMLQERVQKARDSLSLCDVADAKRIRYTPAFMWPAFIAACEATDVELQSSFDHWFQDCVQQSGQALCKHMYSTVKQVWFDRSQNEGSSVSWLDYMKGSSILEQV